MTDKHYQQAAISVNIEPIYLCERLPFCLGNIVKYVLRAPYKGQEKEDLRKACVYIDFAIEQLLRTQIGIRADDSFSPWIRQIGKPDFLDVFRQHHQALEILFAPNGTTSIERLRRTAEYLESTI